MESEVSVALTVPEKAKALFITNQATYEEAAGFKIELATMRKDVVERHSVKKKDAKQKWDDAVEAEKNELTPIKSAEEFLVGRIKSYLDEKERLWRIEQARIEAEERARVEADRQRREAEAKAIRDAEMAVAMEARRREEEARLNAALEAQATGADEEAVAEILETPVAMVPEVAPVEAYMEPAEYRPPVIAAPLVQKVVGTGIRYTWSAEVVDKKKLAKAVADELISEDFIDGNMPKLNSRAKADTTAFNVPGVRAVRK